MQALFEVEENDSYEPEELTGTTRTYYIAADEVVWDYAPSSTNPLTGEDYGDDENVFLKRSNNRIGRQYYKAVYREYTDSSFMQLKSVGPEWEHKGILGPVIRAEVGDTIKVYFKNNARFHFSMNAHGLLYDKDSEGIGNYKSSNAGAGGSVRYL